MAWGSVTPLFPCRMSHDDALAMMPSKLLERWLSCLLSCLSLLSGRGMIAGTAPGGTSGGPSAVAQSRGRSQLLSCLRMLQAGGFLRVCEKDKTFICDDLMLVDQVCHGRGRLWGGRDRVFVCLASLNLLLRALAGTWENRGGSLWRRPDSLRWEI